MCLADLSCPIDLLQILLVGPAGYVVHHSLAFSLSNNLKPVDVCILLAEHDNASRSGPTREEQDTLTKASSESILSIYLDPCANIRYPLTRGNPMVVNQGSCVL